MLLSRFKSVIKTPVVEFLCLKEDFGVIPEPYPARKLMPEWYRHLPPKVEKRDTLENSTIKRCAPFLDAMTLGWIIPLAGDVEFLTNEDSSGVTYKWSFYRTLVENHMKDQISTPGSPHPESPKPPMKFLNYWAIKVPPGYSLLFVSPLNRPDSRFTCMSGLVDADKYFEFINFPFFFHERNYTGIIAAGTPLVQVIPIRRDSIIPKSKVSELSNEDNEKMDLVRRQRRSHESLYRDRLWERK